ncbi:RNA-directed DNA polymerase from mobile element jockey [Plakobranchus ocellatus]|uniref:RNA-directed DNA polymerase from mobile element jockey n=1 Tax=Plakobranchus ocellatus TaxID=259542 RepID=A0AAV4CLQ6_9GAST|nr:RNA-directed DNA polymerase from mobile element jockey [Plakobranchus ocellatus]
MGLEKSLIDDFDSRESPIIFDNDEETLTSDRSPDRKLSKVWTKVMLIPIYKKGKEKAKAESNSLTSCMCNLMEMIVNHGLIWFLEKNNILMNEKIDQPRISSPK